MNKCYSGVFFFCKYRNKVKIYTHIGSWYKVNDSPLKVLIGFTSISYVTVCMPKARQQKRIIGSLKTMGNQLNEVVAKAFQSNIKQLQLLHHINLVQPFACMIA